MSKLIYDFTYKRGKFQTDFDSNLEITSTAPLIMNTIFGEKREQTDKRLLYLKGLRI